MAIDLLKQSCGHLRVDEYVEDLRVVVGSELSHCLLDFLAQNFLLRGWATDTISIYHNESWLLSLISFNIGLERLSHEVL